MKTWLLISLAVLAIVPLRAQTGKQGDTARVLQTVIVKAYMANRQLKKYRSHFI